MVGAFDPGDYRDALLLGGGSGAPVSDVVLQKREKGIHGGVIACRTNAAQRSDHAVATEDTNIFELQNCDRWSASTMHPARSRRRATEYVVHIRVHRLLQHHTGWQILRLVRPLLVCRSHQVSRGQMSIPTTNQTFPLERGVPYVHLVFREATSLSG